MSQKVIHRIVRLDFLIRTKSTGTPKQLAKKLAISERTLYIYIAFLKQLGAVIRYCRSRNCYYYEEEGYFICGFVKSGVS
ncbi:helix-turn-helix domain-containing protein [Flavihumibacter petaseus]|uniref:Putative DNA-binding protein n=1 Tax=Flavihumibacter petaseus NBRC 106054 TaxID=1220578 RepID=A0A0E9MXU9_9BACT|nr:helix-turn-helix domain-containing protein [Flavihumibacter petaseus]GAO41950.1 putative DNA-binding protein [Flavihumibacter petaseus NBRC 106054]